MAKRTTRSRAARREAQAEQKQADMQGEAQGVDMPTIMALFSCDEKTIRNLVQRAIVVKLAMARYNAAGCDARARQFWNGLFEPSKPSPLSF